MKCLSCTKEFEAKRTDARFCSGACRSKYNRTDNERTDKQTDNVTDNESSSVRIKEVSIKAGFCHGCNEPQENLNVCICHICISKGITHESLGVDICSDVSNY